MYGFMQWFNRNLCDVWMNMVNASLETTEGSILMEVIEREDLKALNIELFRSKLYFRLDLKEGDETTALIEAPGSGAGKAEEACEMIRNYFMGKGFWAEFSENLTFFQLEKMESAFE